MIALVIPSALVLLFLVKKLTVIGNIGKTQGVATAINPPKNANIKKLKKHNCSVYYTDDISTGKVGEVVDVKRLMDILSKGYFVLTAPQLQVRFLYVKVYGGKGMLWGKKIHYAVYQQHYDENIYTPLGNFKIWGLAVTGINNLFRSEGFLKGSAL